MNETSSKISAINRQISESETLDDSFLEDLLKAADETLVSITNLSRAPSDTSLFKETKVFQQPCSEVNATIAEDRIISPISKETCIFPTLTFGMDISISNENHLKECEDDQEFVSNGQTFSDSHASTTKLKQTQEAKPQQTSSSRYNILIDSFVKEKKSDKQKKLSSIKNKKNELPNEESPKKDNVAYVQHKLTQSPQSKEYDKQPDTEKSPPKKSDIEEDNRTKIKSQILNEPEARMKQPSKDENENACSETEKECVGSLTEKKQNYILLAQSINSKHGKKDDKSEKMFEDDQTHFETQSIEDENVTKPNSDEQLDEQSDEYILVQSDGDSDVYSDKQSEENLEQTTISKATLQKQVDTSYAKQDDKDTHSENRHSSKDKERIDSDIDKNKQADGEHESAESITKKNEDHPSMWVEKEQDINLKKSVIIDLGESKNKISEEEKDIKNNNESSDKQPVIDSNFSSKEKMDSEQSEDELELSKLKIKKKLKSSVKCRTEKNLNTSLRMTKSKKVDSDGNGSKETDDEDQQVNLKAKYKQKKLTKNRSSKSTAIYSDSSESKETDDSDKQINSKAKSTDESSSKQAKKNRTSPKKHSPKYHQIISDSSESKETDEENERTKSKAKNTDVFPKKDANVRKQLLKSDEITLDICKNKDTVDEDEPTKLQAKSIDESSSKQATKNTNTASKKQFSKSKQIYSEDCENKQTDDEDIQTKTKAANTNESCIKQAKKDTNTSPKKQLPKFKKIVLVSDSSESKETDDEDEQTETKAKTTEVSPRKQAKKDTKAKSKEVISDISESQETVDEDEQMKLRAKNTDYSSIKQAEKDAKNASKKRLSKSKEINLENSKNKKTDDADKQTKDKNTDESSSKQSLKNISIPAETLSLKSKEIYSDNSESKETDKENKLTKSKPMNNSEIHVTKFKKSKNKCSSEDENLQTDEKKKQTNYKSKMIIKNPDESSCKQLKESCDKSENEPHEDKNMIVKKKNVPKYSRQQKPKSKEEKMLEKGTKQSRVPRAYKKKTLQQNLSTLSLEKDQLEKKYLSKVNDKEVFLSIKPCSIVLERLQNVHIPATINVLSNDVQTKIINTQIRKPNSGKRVKVPKSKPEKVKLKGNNKEIVCDEETYIESISKPDVDQDQSHIPDSEALNKPVETERLQKANEHSKTNPKKVDIIELKAKKNVSDSKRISNNSAHISDTDEAQSKSLNKFKRKYHSDKLIEKSETKASKFKKYECEHDSYESISKSEDEQLLKKDTKLSKTNLKKLDMDSFKGKKNKSNSSCESESDSDVGKSQSQKTNSQNNVEKPEAELHITEEVKRAEASDHSNEEIISRVSVFEANTNNAELEATQSKVLQKPRKRQPLKKGTKNYKSKMKFTRIKSKVKKKNDDPDSKETLSESEPVADAGKFQLEDLKLNLNLEKVKTLEAEFDITEEREVEKEVPDHINEGYQTETKASVQCEDEDNEVENEIIYIVQDEEEDKKSDKIDNIQPEDSENIDCSLSNCIVSVGDQNKKNTSPIQSEVSKNVDYIEAVEDECRNEKLRKRTRGKKKDEMEISFNVQSQDSKVKKLKAVVEDQCQNEKSEKTNPSKKKSELDKLKSSDECSNTSENVELQQINVTQSEQKVISSNEQEVKKKGKNSKLLDQNRKVQGIKTTKSKKMPLEEFEDRQIISDENETSNLTEECLRMHSEKVSTNKLVDEPNVKQCCVVLEKFSTSSYKSHVDEADQDFLSNDNTDSSQDKSKNSSKQRRLSHVSSSSKRKCSLDKNISSDKDLNSVCSDLRKSDSRKVSSKIKYRTGFSDDNLNSGCSDSEKSLVNNVKYSKTKKPLNKLKRLSFDSSPIKRKRKCVTSNESSSDSEESLEKKDVKNKRKKKQSLKSPRSISSNKGKYKRITTDKSYFSDSNESSREDVKKRISKIIGELYSSSSDSKESSDDDDGFVKDAQHLKLHSNKLKQPTRRNFSNERKRKEDSSDSEEESNSGCSTSEETSEDEGAKIRKKNKCNKLKRIIKRLGDDKIVRHLSCKPCKQTFKTHRQWVKHDKEFHQNFVYKCDLCYGELFKSRSSYVNHMKYFHPYEKLFFCKFRKCKKSFSSLRKFRNHHKSHYKFLCKYCKEGFMEECKLYDHVIKYHVK